MKKSIIILGLAALSFTTTQAANKLKSQDFDQQELATVNVENTKQESQLVLVNEEMSRETAEIDTTIFNPNSVIKSAYVKTVEDVIVESKLIIEAQEEFVQPLSIDTILDDRIAEDSQIIESTVSKAFFPLDFEKINSKIQCVKAYNSTTTITADLKL